MKKSLISKKVLYPPKPEPLRIEFEVTNFCNASCEFCPRFNIKENGNMDFEKYKRFIDDFKKIKNSLWITEHFADLNLPVIVFGGYGEPLLNTQIFDFIKYAKSRGFGTELITNGLLLTSQNCQKIDQSGLDQLSISLHTLNPELNKKITKLPDVIPNIEKAIKFFDDKKIQIEIWRVSKLNGENYDKLESKDAYDIFLSGLKKKIVVLGPIPAWNRGGQFESEYYPVASDYDQIRCETAYFNLSISYNGDLVICCCDFSWKKVVLARNWNFDLKKIQEKILQVEKNSPKMCQDCRKTKNNYYESFVFKYYKD